MTLSSEVEITHTFLVMKTCKTPLILGMDFLKLASCRPDAVQGILEFTAADGTKFAVDTFDGDGMLKEIGMIPEGAVPEDPETLIIPVLLLEQNAINDKLQDVKLNETMEFGPGETTMLPLKIAAEAARWNKNKAIQPDGALWSRK